ncbi:N-6 DNA methylase [Limnohabitans sp. T6-5]|uniref:N-6 DNA methylase n=1 Tax=Limnohabitans sp. T6-5 TaxID=1100724 RepID=UPI001E3FD5A6|nr:N-6 DNA methylase [Limnohabitans sp. T6-5]
MQELLNASPDHQWGLVTNGKTIRLLRDAATLTRPSYLDIDMADLLSGQRYAEFAYAWRLLHASRAGLQATSDSQAHAPVVWEAWREAGQEEGTRVRNGLRMGVTQALLTFGNGFLQHQANEALRLALQNGELTKEAYFAQLLRLIYRLIFVFSIEERGLLKDANGQTNAAYTQGYALARLRDMALRRRARNRFDDLWQSMRIVFKGLNHGEPRLGLSALGGLFNTSQCPALDVAELSNAHLLATMQSMRWAAQAGGSLAPIDYRNMGVEELGSVYESLLELVPEVDLPARTFGFVGLTSEGSTAGNERKLTGSYYTPDSLVQELIQSALVPVIDQRIAAQPDNPVDALLSIKVCDPACGSGHFLLAAARKLAERLAALRSDDGVVTPAAYRHALREVIARCIYGVDRNPMAIELARTALWLEGFEEGRPLSFLDHHLQVGDALLGLTDLKALEFGIAKDAFKPLSGDDKEVCKLLAKINVGELKDLEKKRKSNAFGQLDVVNAFDSGLKPLQALEALPEKNTQEIAAKESAYRVFLEQAKTNRLAHAADLLVGAYLLPKRLGAESIPTSGTLYLTLSGDELPEDQKCALVAAQVACLEARVLHWSLAFPQVFGCGGFDCVLGNPPWERIKLQEEEFFATRHPAVAAAKNKAERAQRIQWLSEGTLAEHLGAHAEPRGLFDVANPASSMLADSEKRLYAEFITARRSAEAASVFMHVSGSTTGIGGEGGRYPLTGVGDVNTYALFAETILQIKSPTGRAGFIVPTGIATDDSTKQFFGHISQSGQLISLYDIENKQALFESVHRSFKFSLVTLGQASVSEFVFFASHPSQLTDQRRRFSLTPQEFQLINPNTLTCPVFRSQMDAKLTEKIYKKAGCFHQFQIADPWNENLSRIFDMGKSADQLLAEKSERTNSYPMIEAKYFHQYDHRYSSIDSSGNDITVQDEFKSDPYFSINTSYVMEVSETERRLIERNAKFQWLIAYRNITNATNERTIIASVLKRCATNYSVRLCISNKAPRHQAALLANLNSITLDFIARQKLGGTNLSDYVFRQFPILPPENYSLTDLAYIVPRVLELTFTAHDLAAWAQDLGHSGQPFPFNSERRAQLRAELDAYYARLYGLSRDELRYILDPADVMGDDYPSETFRVLKNGELREFGEYRTQRLVLAAWDALE